MRFFVRVLRPLGAGMFGFVILLVLLVPMYYIPASPPFSSQPGHLEDPFDAFAQMRQNWQIVVATFGVYSSKR